MSRHVRAAEMPHRDENVDGSGGSFRREESGPMKSFVRPSFFSQVRPAKSHYRRNSGCGHSCSYLWFLPCGLRPCAPRQSRPDPSMGSPKCFDCRSIPLRRYADLEKHTQSYRICDTANPTCGRGFTFACSSCADGDVGPTIDTGWFSSILAYHNIRRSPVFC